MKRIALVLLAAGLVACEQTGNAPAGVAKEAQAAVKAGCDCGGGNCNGAAAAGGDCNGAGPHGQQAAAAQDAVYRVPLGSAPVQGPADALVTVVEFTDFQCPFCARANQTVDELVKAYGPKIRVAVKQHPLPFHRLAKGAALAALAAGEQGKYWEMHQRLFADQTTLEPEGLEKHAKELGLNIEAWKAAMQAPKLEEQVKADEALASALGATGTPTFFVNGRVVRGAQPLDVFKQTIDQELAKAEAMVKQGVRPGEVYARIIEKGLANAPAFAPRATVPEPPSTEVKQMNIPADAPQKGSRNAKVTVVAFSDFQCPFCTRGEASIKQLQETYGDKVRVVFRNMPLPFHKDARLAAAAALAAHEQGKFWEYHDTLFANQQALDRASLEGHAQKLGLDMARFKSALDTNKFEQTIVADVAEAQRLGVTGTPTFFVNGRALIGAKPFDAFKTLVDEELKK
jgi:protein-disulfide isomerase